MCCACAERNAETHSIFHLPRKKTQVRHPSFKDQSGDITHDSFFLLSGSWSIPGGGPGDSSWVLQRHRGWKGCGPILEEGHLQSDLQTGQRGSRGLQIPQLSTRAPPWLTRPREETKQARQTSEDSEKTVGKCRQRPRVRLVGGLWWNTIEGLWRS